MYVLMRKLHGYRLEHFWDDNFYASQFFALLYLVREEAEEKEKMHKKASKK